MKSVYAIGLGIRELSQLTLEAESLLRNSKKLKAFYIGGNSQVEAYLQRHKIPGEDLRRFYVDRSERVAVYANMAMYIISHLDRYNSVAYLAPGHPALLDRVTEHLVRHAAERNVDFRVLPGVSSVDSLLAYLFVSVGDYGLQIYESSFITVERPRIDADVPLVVMQPALAEVEDVCNSMRPLTTAVRKLQEALLSYYPQDAPWLLLSCTTNAKSRSEVVVGRLSALDQHTASLMRGTLLLPGRWRSVYIEQALGS